MLLTINGEKRDVPENLTISALMAHLGLTGPVAVERNAQVVPRVDHPHVVLAPDDQLEIVHFVGGG